VGVLGGDPNSVKPSPDGGGAVEVCQPPASTEVCAPRDLFCLHIPWNECDLEGEVDIKFRFKKRC